MLIRQYNETDLPGMIRIWNEIVEEGIAFSPVYHLRATKSIKEGGLVTCLNLRKAA